jgi:sec-independent protein translocase protein TatA
LQATFGAKNKALPQFEEDAVMEGKIGLTEILFVVAIALLLFGPSKFASLGKSLGEGIRNFKSAVKPEEDPKKEEEKKS